MTIDWTGEQLALLAHPIDRHGCVLAGPGTGKSTTVLTLATRLLDANGPTSIRVTTFTRAAAAELALRAVEEGHELEPGTVHSFALALLMGNPTVSDLPRPLRIPDSWEGKELVQSDIARRLRGRGFIGTRRSTVERLEREMAARWESLDPELELLSEVSPELRNAYLGVWAEHRTVFGYSLFAEMPLKAAEALEDHPDLELHGLQLLIVDEYQDLNRCEIYMLQALTRFGVHVLGVGDDDQSIYSFRMADPAGIRQFGDDFERSLNYSLSVSQRCGVNVLTPARVLIETAQVRAPKPPLTPRERNLAGEFEYLSFRNQDHERDGVARLVAHLIGRRGLRPSEIVIMLRADHNGVWSGPLRQTLNKRGIPAVDVEQALAPLAEVTTRSALAIARLAVHREDSLAWWSLLRTTWGISEEFESAVTDESIARRERFAQRLARVAMDPPVGAPENSVKRAIALIQNVNAFLDGVDVEGVVASAQGWAPWLLETAKSFGIEVSQEFVDLALNVGQVTPQEHGLAHFLNQLEPVTKDLALQVEGAAIMSMSRSKGLTRRAAITMGVENGVIPSPRSPDVEEERRLLYVAMTRAKEFCYLTMATRRTGPTAFTGSGGAPQRASRGRSPFFSATPIGPRDGESFLATLGA